MFKSSKRNKMSIVLMSLLAMLLVLSACGNSGNSNSGSNKKPTASNTAETSPSPDNAAGVDTSKEVKLKFVFLGPKPVDYDTVFGEVNKILKEKVNATIESEFLDWSDWSKKYPLKFAGGEDFDVIYTSNWAMYGDQSSKGGFLELTEELLSTYAPQTWAAMPKVKWDQAKVDGKIYMIPHNKTSEFTDKLILYRDDLREKYNLEPVTNLETFAAYLKAVGKNEKAITPYGIGGDSEKLHSLDKIMLQQNNEWNSIPDLPFAYKMDDEKGQVFNMYETQEFKDLLAYYKDIADNGGWSRNVLTSKSNTAEDFKAGKVAAMSHNITTLGGIMTFVQQSNPEFKVVLADIAADKKKSAAISTQNGVGVRATSKNPERALMVLDLLQNDKQLHDLIMYGTPGTNYEPVGDTEFKRTDKYANFNSFSNWSFNSPLNRVDTSYPKEAQDLEKKWEAQVYNYKLETFVFDKTNVVNEVANVGNVMMRYGVPLEYGLMNDLAKGQADLIKQLKAAGVDTIQQELQKQIDAFLAK